MNLLTVQQASRLVEAFIRLSTALRDIAFEAKRANDIKERMGR